MPELALPSTDVKPPILACWQGSTRPQDLAITILGGHGLRNMGSVWSGGMVELIREFGHSTEASRAALSRLVARGLFERHRRGRRISYELTPGARQRLIADRRRMSRFGRATGGDVWTFLWHAIPEHRRAERTLLAPRLRHAGFGPLQEAVWIAASDREDEARALIAELGIEAYVSVFLARTVEAAKAPILNSGLWDFRHLGTLYDEFVSNFSPYVKPGAITELTPREAFTCRILLMQAFRGISLLDPELPDSIAPLAGRRANAVEIFAALHTDLAPAAEQYFAEVALTSNSPQGPNG